MKYKTTQIKKWIIIATGIVLLAIICFLYYTFSPALYAYFYPSCSFKNATGFDCVGCGGQRAMHELLHLNLLNAIDYNLLFVVSIPLLLYYIFFSLRHYLFGIPSPNSFLYSPYFGLVFIILILAFLLLRNMNLPFVDWLNSSITF